MQNNDTGKLMKNLYAYMNADAKIATGGLVDYAQNSILLNKGDLRSYRDVVYPAKSQAPKYVFKWSYQLETIFKRFRFKDDAFSDSELLAMMEEKFLATQVRIGYARVKGSPNLRAIITNARKIVKSILGEYSQQRHEELCTFGKNAAVGTPACEAYPDRRLMGPITGSAQHIQFFGENLKRDKTLERLLFSVRKTGETKKLVKLGLNRFQECDALHMTGVPKSFKAFRSIMPNTELGVFYTSGLGEYIVEKLAESGYNLNHRSRRHKRLAQRFSRTRSHVTADLSAASDSFTSCLVNALVPRKWYNALKRGRIDCYTDSHERRHKMISFMTMGIGFTFPLQTLLFYSLIKAIGELLEVQGVYSVFGDDLIYPRKIHKYVKYYFQELGFVLNVDKTFVEDYFRESCGGDYFKGIDVRPFQPEGCASTMGRCEYLSFLYKIVNGLLMRWDREEIPMTLDFLFREILRQGLPVFQVPPSFPEDSGWHVKRFVKGPFFSPIVYNTKIHGYAFTFLTKVTDTETVLDQYPWYWEKLIPSKGDDTFSIYSSEIPPIKWKMVDKKTRKRVSNNSYLEGRYENVKMYPLIARRNSARVTCQATQASTWDLGVRP